jgi:hypothetical protein
VRESWLADPACLWQAGALVLLAGLGVAHLLRTPTDRRAAWLDFLLPLAVGLLTRSLVWGVDPERASNRDIWLLFGIPAVLCFTFVGRPLRFGLGVAFLALGAGVAATAVDDALYRERSFFGVVTVGEKSRTFEKEVFYRAHLASPDGPRNIPVEQGETLKYRWLYHGSTLHGRQFLGDDLRDVPLTYYHENSPVGQLLRAANKDAGRPLGVIGLGTGTLACYALPGQHLTFYEIDPLIRDIAYDPDTALFSFVSDARQRGAHVDFILGDARVRLSQQQPDKPDRYGILVVDAFSSDAIPVHLITREALEVYLSHLRSDGILAFHITNQHLDLEPVLANLAADLGLAALYQEGGYDERPSTLGCKWMLLARRPEHLRCGSDSPDWKPPQADPRLRVWTDDYSNVLSVFRK